MAKEYIERANALREMRLRRYFETADVITACDAVCYVPAADVAPVVRGKWNTDGSCSVCGYYIPTDDAHDAIFKSDVHYCYHCGAKQES